VSNGGKRPGIALAVSGGGYRATLFHLGTLWRLNEMAYLPMLTRITSVSGGSITSGVLGQRWNQLEFNELGVATNFEEVIAKPLQAFCTITPSWGSGLVSCLKSFIILPHGKTYQNRICWRFVPCHCTR
jgi:hypothetical protein